MSSAPTRDEAIRQAETQLHCARKLLEGATTNWGKRFFGGEVELAERALAAAKMQVDDEAESRPEEGAA